jgi:hypothetical protein
MLVSNKDKIPKIFEKMLKEILVAPALFDNLIRDQDGYKLEQAVKILIKNSSINRVYARKLIEQLLSIYEDDKSNLFIPLYTYVKNAVIALTKICPEEVWSAFSPILLRNEQALSLKLGRFFDNSSLEESLLVALPTELYLKWVREDPLNRAPILASWLPLTMKAENGVLSWHPILEEFILEYGGDNNVLLSLAERWMPVQWIDSRVPHLEQFLYLLGLWSTHKHLEVRNWVTDQITWLKEKIAKEKNDDDESFIEYG